MVLIPITPMSRHLAHFVQVKPTRGPPLAVNRAVARKVFDARVEVLPQLRAEAKIRGGVLRSERNTNFSTTCKSNPLAPRASRRGGPRYQPSLSSRRIPLARKVAGQRGARLQWPIGCVGGEPRQKPRDARRQSEWFAAARGFRPGPAAPATGRDGGSIERRRCRLPCPTPQHHEQASSSAT
jgi:hypothetical protein